MNVIYLHSHNTGRNLGCYGAPVDTPNIDELAREGVLFRKVFCASPSCSASYASLMTGQYAHKHGLIGLAHCGSKMHNPEDHLAWRLRELGFQTKLIGLQHVIPWGSEAELGYQGVVGPKDLPSNSGMRCRIVADWLRQNQEQPFFLDIGLSDELAGLQDAEHLESAIQHLDEGVGIVLDALKETGLDENTFVIFTTDHGTPFAKANATLYDDGLGVALIVLGPGGYEGGKVVDALVSQIDVLPTLFDLLGQDVPSDCEGSSILPLARGEADAVRWAVFAETNDHVSCDALRCIRTPRYKYIRHFANSAGVQLAKSPHTDSEVGTEPQEHEMLFDLLSDPHELQNLVDNREYLAIKEELSRMLDEWMKETDDPILDGDLDLPEEAPPHT